MRSHVCASPAARLVSIFTLGALSTGCGLIDPTPPDGQVVLPLEAGADDDAVASSDDGGTAEEDDAATEDGDAASDDAATDTDAAAPEADASSDGDADAAAEAGPQAPDAACEGSSCADAGAAGCNADEQCGGSEYCSKRTHACSPRCDAEGTCVGPALAPSNNRVLSDERHVCYAGDGPNAGEYTVFAWDGSSPAPLTLASGAAARVLLVADGYCYFHAGSTLQRAALTGGPAETVQSLATAPLRSWMDAKFLWWSVVTGDQLQLFRLARSAGTTPEQVLSGPASESWEASNSTHLFRRFSPSYAKCAIAMAPITDPSNVTVIPMSLSKNCTCAFWASDESIVFTQFEPVRHYLFRVDLTNPTQEATIMLYSVEPLMYQVRGDWAYGQRVVDGSNVPGVPNTVSYWRAPIDGGDAELLFTPTPGTAEFYVEPYDFQNNVHRTYAVLDDLRLIYQHKTEHRLLVHALPAEGAR